ncbi:NEDD8-conjugating enzyme UBE2F [Galendromus occidentalis]|uniref:E2 NEDD8-conjugating enzyme n=1 Tax=Galendromus occidentalis TaxID=34638 RepID=A0AAJ6QVP9_9ACAR|nr:NEDD8-conjugating enzyme UBE2F [Galendromus occidentalis]
MITLRKRVRRSGGDGEDDGDSREPGPSRPCRPGYPSKKLSIRDQLLQKEVMELNQDILPNTVRVHFPDPNAFHHLMVSVCPSEGLWSGGVFDFEINVPEEYNMAPPKVKCLTPSWHPNINFRSGEICLSLLRVSAIDNMGWTPTRRLRDVVLGLDGLFGDLVNFEDPLNKDAADQYQCCSEAFEQKVRDLIRQNFRSRRR